ncbi:MAG TPA: N-acetylneuraminate synthase family protein [Treponemataceae bacterium]|nr:N-acetylneuraminate synthase family protein [Treponemataceae bacterium]
MYNIKHAFEPALIIAEIGTAHDGSFDKAKKLVNAAIEAGADCIKFQWVYADEILHPNTGFVTLPSGNISLYNRFKELEVEPVFFYKIKEYIHSKQKLFCCSPFGIKSLRELFALKPDYIKIASPELNHYPLLKELVRLELSTQERIPVIISSGVSTLSDIKKTLQILNPIIQHNTNSLSLLHCITSYPAPEIEYNLSLIPALKKQFNIPIGVSDHSLDPYLIPVLSIACGAHIIEKHITLSNEDTGLDDPVALNKKNFKKMVTAVRRAEIIEREALFSDCFDRFGKETVEKIIGNGKKKLAKSEKAHYGRTNRSIHVMNNMKAGSVITKNDIAVLRTEKNLKPGMSPEYFESLFGNILNKDISAGQGLLLDDIFEKQTKEES